jgi:hypothetical protein
MLIFWLVDYDKPVGDVEKGRACIDAEGPSSESTERARSVLIRARMARRPVRGPSAGPTDKQIVERLSVGGRSSFAWLLMAARNPRGVDLVTIWAMFDGSDLFADYLAGVVQW